MDPIFPFGDEKKGFIMIPIAVNPAGNTTVDPLVPE
jgi:hypothetical protein